MTKSKRPKQRIECVKRRSTSSLALAREPTMRSMHRTHDNEEEEQQKKEEEEQQKEEEEAAERAHRVEAATQKNTLERLTEARSERKIANVYLHCSKIITYEKRPCVHFFFFSYLGNR